MGTTSITDTERAEIDRLKGTFLANLNHEVRTPLSGILGMTDLLLETRLDEEQLDYVSTVRLCAENLFHLLNATLEYSALTAGHLKLDETEFGLREMVDSALAMEREKAEAKGLKLTATLDAALPQTMIGDATRMQDLLGHLLDNAIKFTHRGSVGFAVERADGAVLLRVRDTGIGIAPEYHETVFEPFRQVDDAKTRTVAGTGLGLTVSRELARLLGGDVTVESGIGAGSVFTVRLPARDLP